jgi:hypothetical protein
MAAKKHQTRVNRVSFGPFGASKKPVVVTPSSGISGLGNTLCDL